MKISIFRSLVAAAVLGVSTMAEADPLSYTIDAKASLKKISIYQKNVRKRSDERLFVFDVTINNVDTVAHLYSVTVNIPGIGAGEGFAPAKGAARVDPGADAVASVAVLSQNFPTNGYSITVRAVDER